MASTLKRTLDDDEEIEIKRLKTETTTILHFSDCVLLNILSYLKPYDLYCLSKTCQRFKYLIKDKKFWKKLDVLDHPMCARKFNFFFENANSSTESILVCGISKKEKTLTLSQFLQLNKVCENLTVLAIENQYINSDEIGLKDFPCTLKELSLRGTHIYGWRSFLQWAYFKLIKLHTLILASCKWLSEHSLMALSKLPSLENLSLYQCTNLSDSVAYMSITAKFGFRRLLRIDVRQTGIGDQFLKCFHSIRTLREIYLEAPKARGRRKRSVKVALVELQRLCAETSTPHAVVFSARPKNGLKSPKKHKRPPVSQVLPRTATFNCVHNCQTCSLDNCSVIPNQTNDSQSQCSTQTSIPVASQSPQATFEIRANGQDFECSNSNTLQLPPNSQICEIRLFSACANSQNVEDGFPGQSNGRAEEKTEEKSTDDEAETAKNKAELLYCDDVSDTEDEDSPVDDNEPGTAALLDHEALQADVTDAGVQWFLSARPDTEDPLGQPSILFRPPYSPLTQKYSEQQPQPGPSRDIPAPVPVEEGPHLHPARDLRVIIERLDPGVHIVYEGVGDVGGTTRLRVLVARGYPRLTDAALRSLAPLRLELLDVTRTAVTPEGLEQFHTLNPDCRLIHDTMNKEE